MFRVSQHPRHGEEQRDGGACGHPPLDPEPKAPSRSPELHDAPTHELDAMETDSFDNDQFSGPGTYHFPEGMKAEEWNRM